MTEMNYFPTGSVNSYLANNYQVNGFRPIEPVTIVSEVPTVVGTPTTQTPLTGWGRVGQVIGNAWNGFKSTGTQLGNATGKLDLGQKGSGLLGLGMGAMNAFNAYKANKLAQEQFKFQKQAWQANYDNQRKMTNSQLEDRQKARVANNPIQNESVDSYMRKYGV